ncbi:MAG: TolC family protein [Ferruginibacter sp.]
MKAYFLLLLIVVLVCKNCFAQSIQQQVLPLDKFILLVKKYHPIAKLANIQIDKASADFLAAKANFDTVFQWEASNKTISGKNYYYYNNPELTIPLPVGNVKAGLGNNGGDLLPSEISKGQTSYLGLELPLAKGLLMDKRRAVLQQAKLFIRQSAQERFVILNDLLFESYVAYWQWAGAYQQYMAYSRFVELADRRLRLVRISFINGDRALMDTTETFTQFQNYQLLQTEALLKWKNAGIELSNYLWKEDDSVYLPEYNQLPEYTLPGDDIVDKNLDELIVQSALQNPALKIYDYKLNSLEVERKLKLQNLRPYFSVKANLLTKDYNMLNKINRAFIEDNHKWGIDFKIPLFLREARGEYKRSQLEIKETNFELLYKRQQMENKIRTYYNEYNSIQQQLKVVQNMYGNYQNLLRSEELKLAQGESSLFLVNSREMKLIEVQQKQIELTVKYFKAKYAVEWAMGMLK